MKVIPLSANPAKWLNTLKQFVGKFSTNCLSVFDHFLGLALRVITDIFETDFFIIVYWKHAAFEFHTS